MSGRSAGILLVGIGAVVAAIGLLVWSGALRWFGRLPGDIRVARGNVRFTFPLVSMLLVSAALTIVVNLLARLFRR